VNLQILKFDEHWNLRRPHSNYRKGPRKCAQRRKSLREQLLRIKGLKRGVKEGSVLPEVISASLLLCVILMRWRWSSPLTALRADNSYRTFCRRTPS
jgi:hypothetical protein